MKKKIIFAVATGLFAVATVFNINMLQSNSASDISLESIAVMSQAEAESYGGWLCAHVSYSTCLWDDGFSVKGSWQY